MLNIPVSNTFAVRAAFATDRHDGYSHNAPGRDYNDLDSAAGRIEAYWKPTDTFNALLAASIYHNGGVGGGITGGAPLGIYADSAGATPYRYQEPDAKAYTDELTRDVTATLNYELPFATATYVGNYRSDHYSGAGQLAVQGPIVTTFDPPGICASAGDPTCFTLNVRNNGWQTSHELRLGHATQALKWVLGAYYFKYSDKNIGSISPCPCGQPFDIYTPGVNVETSKAVFGQATVSPVRPVHLTVGVRYNDEYKKTSNVTYTGPIGSVQGFDCIGCTPAAPTGGTTTVHKVTWRAAADVDLTHDIMAFFSVANGFKNGGVNDDGSAYKPESIINYELGLKTNLFDHRLQINIDAFHELYTDYQSTAGQLVDNTVSLVTVNAGKATINGVELESTALVTPDDRISINGTYLHARFTSFYLPFGDGFNGNQPEDLSGRRVPYTPAETVRLEYQHTFRFGSGATLVPSVDTSYVASQELDYHNFAATHVPSYTRTGLSLTYNAPKIDGRVGWSIMGWAKNLENHAVLVTGQVDNTLPQSLVGQGGKDGFYLAPRTYGVKLTATF